jgi:Dickkopf N-terminal cysteine-rich region
MSCTEAVRAMLLTSFAVLAGCGEYSRPPASPDAGQEPDACSAVEKPDVASLGTRLYDAICAALSRCDPFTIFSSKEECVASFDQYFDGTQTKYLRRLGEALDHGTVTIDKIAMQRCFDELSLEACPVSLDREACRSLFVGTVAAGASCYGQEECAAPGASCRGFDPDATCRAGTCGSSAAVGEACSEQTPCVPGAHCVGVGAAARCETGEQGARCGDHADCDDHRWCKQGACVAALPGGAACTLDAQCGGDSLCVGELSSPSGMGMCTQVTQVGAACDDYCFRGLYCKISQVGANGSCAPLPALGEPCLASLGRCAGVALYCSDRDLCAATSGLGESCAIAPCLPGMFCSSEVDSGNPAECLALRPLGARCVRDGNCASYHCDNGMCAAPASCRGPAPDSPCLE